MNLSLFEELGEEMAAPPASSSPRQFWRCLDCLSVMATDGQLSEFQHYEHGRGVTVALRCLCGGCLDHMGHVHRDRLVRTEYACPCDARCTNAPGPKCECQCGGANHGTGIVVPVRRDLGAAPTVTPPNAARACLIATAFRAAKADAKDRIDWAYRRNDGERRSEARRAILALNEAARILNHKQRLQALERIGRA
jgi:hypothetical protein